MRRRDRAKPSSDSGSDVDLFESPVQKIETHVEKPAVPTHLDDLAIAIPFDWNGYDSFFIVIFLFLGLFTRMWNLQDPRSFLPRENHTYQILQNYQTHRFFRSETPELGYLLVSFIASRMQLHVSVDQWLKLEHGGFGNRAYVSLRSISSFPAAVVVPLVFMTLRLFGCNRLYSFYGGVFCLLERGLIVPAREVGFVGLVELFVVLTLIFCALSRHIAIGCFSQFLMVVLGSAFAGMAIASEAQTIPFAVLAVVWPWLVHKNKRQCLACLGVVLGIVYLSSFVHLIIVTEKVKESESEQMSSYQKRHFLTNTSTPQRLRIAHFVSAGQELVYRTFRIMLQFLKHLSVRKVIQTLLLSSSTVEIRSKVLFGPILCFYQLIHPKIGWRSDTTGILCILFVATAVISSCNSDLDYANMYLPLLVNVFTGIMCVPRYVHTRTSSTILTILVFICGYSFKANAQFTYASLK